MGALAVAAALALLPSLGGARPEGPPDEPSALVVAAVPESTLIPDGWR